MKLPDFDFVEPPTLEEVCALLAEDPGGSVVFAGGTDILVDLRERRADYRRLVSLARIEELGRITYSDDAGLVVGAMATVNQLARHAAVTAHYPGIVDAALCVAADQVRNQATVVGNLCMAVPSADMAPIMLAYDAGLRVASSDGERLIPVRNFFTGPRRTVLETADVVVGIEVAAPGAGFGDANQRHGGRVSLSLPIASTAAVVDMNGDLCREASVALGAVAPTPLLASSVGDYLAGKTLTDETLREAGRLARAEARPIDDLRASKAYRLDLVEVLTRRALTTAADRAQKVKS